MSTEQPSDLGAILAEIRGHMQTSLVVTQGWCTLPLEQVAALVAAYDAQSARLATLTNLEAAARAWNHQHPFCVCGLCRALNAAVAALDGGAGEPA